MIVITTVEKRLYQTHMTLLSMVRRVIVRLFSVYERFAAPKVNNSPVYQLSLFWLMVLHREISFTLKTLMSRHLYRFTEMSKQNLFGKKEFHETKFPFEDTDIDIDLYDGPKTVDIIFL